MEVRTGEHIPSLTGYIGEKMYVDLVSMTDTMRGNQYLLTVEDSISRYCHAYPILNKEACTVAKVLMDQYFNIYGLPDRASTGNSVSVSSRKLLKFFFQQKKAAGNPLSC